MCICVVNVEQYLVLEQTNMYQNCFLNDYFPVFLNDCFPNWAERIVLNLSSCPSVSMPSSAKRDSLCY